MLNFIFCGRSYNLYILFILYNFLVSCDVFEEDIKKDEVQLLAPQADDTLSKGDVLFWWSDLEGANKYHFQLVKPSFSDAREFLVDSVLTEIDSINQEANKLTIRLDTGSYQWRVKAENFGYETEYTQRQLTVK